jgi:hypothetical protein
MLPTMKGLDPLVVQTQNVFLTAETTSSDKVGTTPHKSGALPKEVDKAEAVASLLYDWSSRPCYSHQQPIVETMTFDPKKYNRGIDGDTRLEQTLSEVDLESLGSMSREAK